MCLCVSMHAFVCIYVCVCVCVCLTCMIAGRILSRNSMPTLHKCVNREALNPRIQSPIPKAGLLSSCVLQIEH